MSWTRMGDAGCLASVAKYSNRIRYGVFCSVRGLAAQRNPSSDSRGPLPCGLLRSTKKLPQHQSMPWGQCNWARLLTSLYAVFQSRECEAALFEAEMRILTRNAGSPFCSDVNMASSRVPLTPIKGIINEGSTGETRKANGRSPCKYCNVKTQNFRSQALLGSQITDRNDL